MMFMKRVVANMVELEDGSVIRNGVVETDEHGQVTRIFSLDDMNHESARTVYVGEKLKIKNNKIWQRN